MAITRTVLSPTGLVQPQHGSTAYEADMDGNLSLINDLFSATGIVFNTAGINGVYSGFTLATSASLTPGLAGGVLYAQGVQYTPSSPTPGAAPASATSYLFYNTLSGFYYQSSAVAANVGDALIGKVTTSAGAVTAVVQATTVFGWIAVAPGAAGNFTVPHLLGRAPVGVSILQNSAALVWAQNPTEKDAINLYLAASDASATAKVQVW
jgi:hypothetical protein